MRKSSARVRRKSPKSPKGDLRNSQLLNGQDHPFQPQYSHHKGHEEHIPYQSIKNSIPTVNQQQPPSMEMRNMGPMHGSFHNPAFPSDEIRPPQNQNTGAPNLPMPNISMFTQNNTNGPPPPMYPPNQPQPLAPNPLNGPPPGFGMAPNPMNIPPPPAPLAPNPMNTPSLDPAMAAAGQNFFQQLGGFNNFYYNALDPTLGLKKNEPVKVQSSKHWKVLAGNVILIGCIIVMAVGMTGAMEKGPALGAIGGGTVAYLILAVGFSDIRKYIFNLKPLADYQALYNKMRQGRAYFIFSIECYHYKTTTHRNKKGKTSTRRKKVVTHTARDEFNPTRVQDDSGEITALKVFTSYAFVRYLKRFYFADPGSESRFINAFNRFVSNNRRDVHQDYRYTFEIAGYEEKVGFSQSGQGQHSKALFIIFTILALAYPYSMYFENNVSRFEIKLLKKLMV